MKTKACPYNFIFNMLIFLGVSATAFAAVDGDVEVKKAYNKQFSADKNTVVELSNRYGKININTWDKSEVKIDVTVIVKAGSKSKAEDKLNEISVGINKNGNNIVAVTEISSSNSSWWSGWWNGSNNVKIEINYEIFMPADLHSIIENKYGNIYLPNLKGKTSINLKYGNLQARDITNDLLMDIAYGKATVGEVNNLSGNLSYSDYRGTSAGVVILTTKYSKVHLDNAKTFTSSSKYDSYRLGTVNTLTLTGAYDDIQIGSMGTGTLNTKYSGIDISSLSSVLTSDISYGSLTIENLKTSFKSITVNTSYAPVKIYGVVPAKVEVEGKYFDADLGADFIQKHKVSEGSSKVIKGYKISDKTGAVINITSKYGDVIIR